ncbi:MAG: hypothetical protein U0V75_17370 [Ferruginibacter sp.]
MRAAAVNEIKEELKHLPADKLVALCLRLSRFKKENKELLTFLLFEAHDIPGYIASVKAELDVQFENINRSSVYFVKKSLRKMLRTAAKYTRYSGDAVVETELLLHFCRLVNSMEKNVTGNTVVINILQNQYKKIRAAIGSMHEDLQYEYQKEMDSLH